MDTNKTQELIKITFPLEVVCVYISSYRSTIYTSMSCDGASPDMEVLSTTLDIISSGL